MLGLYLDCDSPFAGVEGWRVASRREATQSAARALLEGGIAVFPTDTVYGIAAHPGHPEAIERIYAAKRRRPDKPIAFLASDASAPRAFGAAMPSAAADLASRNWPGALTLVLDCESGTEGFRVPDLDFARDIIAAAGGLLRVTSANFSGEPPLASLSPCALPFLGQADVVIDFGPCPGGSPSAVIRVTASNEVSILRHGPVAMFRA